MQSLQLPSAPPRLSVVIPCYNEEASIRACWQRVTAACERHVGSSYEIIMVNDGSRDATLDVLRSLADRDKHLLVVDLSRNHGHQLALSAGLSFARGELTLVLDADLQDPPELLGDMLRLIDAGADVVFGQRRARSGESWFKIG